MTTLFETEVSVTEDKTIFEEDAERTSEQKAEERRVERAYRLLSQGGWEEADALFDEVLKASPDNKEARMGKRIVSRKKNVGKRMAKLDARAKKPSLQLADGGIKSTNNRTWLWILLVAVLLGAGIAIVLGTGVVSDDVDFSNPVPAATETVEPTQTAAPVETQSAEDFLNEHLFTEDDLP